MSRIIPPTRATLLLVILFFVVSDLALAQDRFTEHCLERVEKAVPQTSEHVLAKIMLTSALRRQDLNSALANATEAVDLARSIEDEAVLSVANAHVELIQRMIDLKPVGNANLVTDAIDLLSPELQLHVLLPVLESELCYGGSTAKFEQLLLACQTAATECTDPYLLIQQEALDLYVRVYKLGASPMSAEIIQQRDEVRQESQKLKFQPGIVVALLVESIELRKQKRFEEQLVVLGEALAAAKVTNDNLLMVRANEALSVAFSITRKWDQARDYSLEALRLSEALGSQPFMIDSLNALMAIELQAGRQEEAAIYQQRRDKLAAFEHLRPTTQNALNRISVWIYSRLGDLDAVEELRKLISEYEFFASWMRVYQDDVDSMEAKTIELTLSQKGTERESAAKEQQHQAETRRIQDSHSLAAAETQQSLEFLRKYALATTLLVVLLVSCFGLLIMRSRLKTVSQALDSERETSHRSQTKCDELAVRLNRLQRMESLGLMAGSVAHDFNNILVGVMGNAEVIQLRQKTNPGVDHADFVKQRVGSIIKSAQKAASLSRQMLAYAGKQYIARRATDLNELIRQYQPILESACRANQELKLNLCADPVVSKVDLTQIEQVVLNLITNAVEASSDDGRITITTGFQTIDDIQADCSLYGTRSTGGEFCFIDVADSGSGISQLDMERIFEPFFTNSELGRGLGLSVVYGVVTGHEGFIKCSSNVGQGTSFQVLLPVSPEPAVNSQSDLDAELEPRSEHEAAPQVSPKQKVLVIDDEETVLDLCSQLIQLNGWEAETALGGEEGLRLATRYADELSCILVDVVMPEMGASELLRELDDRGINLPVVVMSGFSHTRLDFFLDRPNVVSIVEKPFRVNQIKQAVQNAIHFGLGNQFVTTARLVANEADYANKARH